MTGAGVSFIFSNYLSGNITLVVNRLNEIANGNLTADDVKVKTRDEIAQLVHGLNRMKQSLLELVSKISETSQQVAASSEELTASSYQSSTAVQQMAEMAQSTAEGAEQQSRRMSEISSFMHQASVHIRHIDTSCHDMSHRSQQAI